MGVSMSKSVQSRAELLETGNVYNGVIEDKDASGVTSIGKETDIVESYNSTDLDFFHKEFSEPTRQETKVIQILCAADDEDLGNNVLKDIWKLDTDNGADIQIAKTKFRAPKQGGCTRLNKACPVFISTLAERPTRVNSANFSPHAVVSDDDVSGYIETEATATEHNDANTALTNSNTKFNKQTLGVGFHVDSVTHLSNNSDVVSGNELDETTRNEIEEILAIDVDLSEESFVHTKDINNYRHLPVPSATSGMHSPKTRTDSRQSRSDVDKSVNSGSGSKKSLGRLNSVGSLSVLSNDDASEQLCAEYLSEVRESIKDHGFFERFPTPTVICEAQKVHRKLDLPVPKDKDGSILPHPPNYTKQDVFNAKASGSNEIDIRILNAPETLVQEGQPSDVVAYLCNGLHDNVDKIRAISTWLAVRQVQNAGGTKSNSDMPGKWCKIFRTMCRCCQIKTKPIEGIIRGPKYLPGDDIANHRGIWVAVLVNDTWWIVDPVLKKSMSDDFAETANKHLTVPTDTRASPGLFNYTESFFSDPEQFIFTHYPDDQYWQLLARPIDHEELAELVVLRHGFFTLGMKLGNQTKSVIHVDKEEVLVTLDFPEQTLRQFMCKLYYCGSSGLETEIKLPRGGSVSLRRYLFTETVLNKHLVNIKVRLPKKGSYVLDIYGCSECHPWQKVVTYKLVCEQYTGTSSFLVSTRDEWGPGMDAHAMGLSPLSYDGGEIVIDKVVTQVSFKDKNGLQFKHEMLKENAKIDSEQVKLSFLRDKSQEVVFIIDMEPKLEGTYVLQLSARSDTSKPYTNFCNYLIRKVECVKERRNAVPRFDFTKTVEKKTIHRVPDSGRLLLECDMPDVCDLNVKFKLHDKQELNYSEHARKWIEDNRGFVDLNFPRKGKYSVKIQTKTPGDSRFKTVRHEHFQADIPSTKWSPFPKVEPSWTSHFKIEEPLNHHLEEKEDETFTVFMTNVQDVAVLAAGGWYHLDQIEDGIWRGRVWTGPRSTRCKLLARFEVGSEKFSDLLWFKVMGEEDFYKLEDRQDTLRENAFKENKHQL